MMFKNWKRAGAVLFCVLVLVPLFCKERVYAKTPESVPAGDILIMYSDSASDEDLKNVMDIVEILTYQSFQVTYAPATVCLGKLNQFSHILCYKIEHYPDNLVEELKSREDEGNGILKAREEIKNSSGENDIRILFVGNDFLKSYLNETGRKNSYLYSPQKGGKLLYSFDGQTDKEALVREDNYLFLSDQLNYKSGTLEVDGIEGYYCGRIGSLYHIPVADLSGNLVKAAFVKEVAQWKWPFNGEPHTYAQYMVINKVYPFQDPDKLLEIVKYMIDKKEPFVISVMPIYSNGNFPAMQHFCEVLRYAQANGGVILLHSPINQMAKFDVDLVNDYLTKAVKIYMDQGVYPMGIQAPHNWMFNSDTIKILSHFRTVLVSDQEDTLIEPDEDVYTNQIYKDGHQWIAPAITLDATKVGYLKIYSTAVYFNMEDDSSVLEERVRACAASKVPLKSLWDVDHSFWTDEDTMTYTNHIILINGKRVETTFTPTKYSNNFKYNRNMLQRYSKDLTNVNKNLIWAVIIISLIFVGFILRARYQNKQRFFIRERKRIEKSEIDLTEESLEKSLQERENSLKKSQEEAQQEQDEYLENSNK